MRTAEVSRARPVASRFPGLVVVAVATLVARAVSVVVPGSGMLTVAVLLGVVVGNSPGVPVAVGPGLAWASRVLLRCGVVLLGLQLAVGQVLGLGAATLAVVVTAVVVTFFGTLLAGRVLGVSRGLSVLVATGFSICGASAIAAVEGVVEREDDEVATSVALVTVFGTSSMVLLPLAAGALGPADFGRLAGGSVHEVAQVVAAASPLGVAAVTVAVVVKLSRVVLLAPLVMLLGAVRRGRGVPGRRPPLPWFVAGFLVAMLVRTSGTLPMSVLAVGEQVTAVLLAAALFALGTSVRPAALARTGPKGLVLGAVATALITGATSAGLLVLG